MELQARKPNRLENYDYSQNGAYFITLCTHNRQNLFILEGNRVWNGIPLIGEMSQSDKGVMAKP